MKWSAAFGGTAAVTGGLSFGLQKVSAENSNSDSKSLLFRSANTPECLHCALLIHVEDGQVKKITGDPNFNIMACGRGTSRINQLYSPHRLHYPMKRVGERGAGEWERISWDEALDTIADRMKTIRSESGNEAFLPLGGTGNWSSLSTGISGLFSAFWNRFGGATPTISSLCCPGVTEGFNAALGGNRSEFRDEWIHSRYFIAWGNNPAVSNVGYFKNIVAARRDNGAKLVTIDPRHSETAGHSDMWLPIRPGTDVALALGMINTIMTEKLFDESYVKEHTNAPFLVKLGKDGIDLEAESKNWTPGTELPISLQDLELLTTSGDGDSENPTFFVWDEETGKHVPSSQSDIKPALYGSFEIDNAKYQPVHQWMAAIAKRYTPEAVEALTQIPRSDALNLAREYAAAKPATIIQNMAGAQRTDQGTLLVLSHIYLAALTGNIGVLGGGVNDNGGVTQFVPIGSPVPLQDNPPIEPIPQTAVAKYLLEEKPHKVRMLYVAGTNVMTQHPDTNSMIEAFERMDFVVVQDPFMTSTAKYADIVLPACTSFETRDVLAGIRSRYIQLMEQAIEPLYESRSDHWILTELAKRLGFGEDFDRPIDDLIRNVLEPTGVSLEEIEKGPVLVAPEKWIPFGDKKFNTPSGRIEFFSTYLQQKGFDPILEYKEPVEAPWVDRELAKKYPLQLVNRRNHNQVNSSFIHHQNLTEIWPGQVVQINSSDANQRGIVHGGKVSVFNDRGTMEATADVTDQIRPGVISVTTGWGITNEKENPSQLTPSKLDPISLGQTLNSSMVEVKLQ